MIFCDGGSEKVFITSADLMPRNLDYRIEVTCPIFDKSIKTEIRRIFDIQWSDNVKARIFDEQQSNSFAMEGKPIVHSQLEVYKFIRVINDKTPVFQSVKTDNKGDDQRN
jgi:polyphosphate kinase